MYVIFADGSSRGNPGPGGWGVLIIGPDRVKELGGRENTTTNNIMELTAAYEALQSLSNTREKIIFFADSQYVLRGITSWVKSWQKNGWLTTKKEPVENRALWVKLINASDGKDIDWRYSPGHRGVLGNEIVDQIATSFADDMNEGLFFAPRAEYEKKKNVRINDILSFTGRETARRAAPYYLAYLNGEARSFKTWDECKRFVSGARGAKYKKVFSTEEEERTLRGWRERYY